MTNRPEAFESRLLLNSTNQVAHSKNPCSVELSQQQSWEVCFSKWTKDCSGCWECSEPWHFQRDCRHLNYTTGQPDQLVAGQGNNLHPPLESKYTDSSNAILYANQWPSTKWLLNPARCWSCVPCGTIRFLQQEYRQRLIESPGGCRCQWYAAGCSRKDKFV